MKRTDPARGAATQPEMERQSVNASSESGAPKGRWLWVGVALAILIAVLLLLWDVEDTANVTQSKGQQPLPVVSVVDVEAAEAVATVSVFAQLRPRWDAEIRAAVSGRIISVAEGALAGQRVEAGAPLFSIEKTRYEAATAAAELSLEEAKLAHWNARNGVTLAKRQFERDGKKPPNELALRLPQLRIAKRHVASAEAQLQAAKRQLADTEVTAPFSGLITRRMASFGQTVAAGEPLLHLSDDRQYELVVELTQADWTLLKHPISGTTTELFHRDGTALGKARIRQGGGFLDQETRQPRIFLEVTNPGDRLLAGDFVRVVFTGRAIPNTVTVPESALSRSGHIWMVDADDRLVRVKPDILFRDEDALVIAAPEGDGPWRIAVTPLASFLPGMRVAPRGAEV